MALEPGSIGEPQFVQNFADSSFEPQLVQNFTWAHLSLRSHPRK